LGASRRIRGCGGHDERGLRQCPEPLVSIFPGS
jgi:hypothetical protein